MKPVYDANVRVLVSLSAYLIIGRALSRAEGSRPVSIVVAANVCVSMSQSDPIVPVYRM